MVRKKGTHLALGIASGLMLGTFGLGNNVLAEISIPQNNLTVINADVNNNVTTKRTEKYKGDDWYTIKGTAKKNSKIYVLADQTGNDPTHYSKLDVIKVNKHGNWHEEISAVDKENSTYYFTPDKSANKSSKKIQNINNVTNKLKVVLPANKGTEVEPFNAADYQTNIAIDQLARNPQQYKGQKIALTGSVLQSDETEPYLLVAVNGDSDNLVYVPYDSDILNGSRILEDDLVTFYGTANGTYSYETVNGSANTIPSFKKIAKIDDQGTASDDYGY